MYIQYFRRAGRDEGGDELFRKSDCSHRPTNIRNLLRQILPLLLVDGLRESQ